MDFRIILLIILGVLQIFCVCMYAYSVLIQEPPDNRKIKGEGMLTNEQKLAVLKSLIDTATKSEEPEFRLKAAELLLGYGDSSQPTKRCMCGEGEACSDCDDNPPMANPAQMSKEHFALSLDLQQLTTKVNDCLWHLQQIRAEKGGN